MSDKEQRIRTRAYEIYEQDGRPDGRAEEHWQQAKREIEHALASAQAQAAEAPAQPPTTADEPTRQQPAPEGRASIQHPRDHSAMGVVVRRSDRGASCVSG